MDNWISELFVSFVGTVVESDVLFGHCPPFEDSVSCHIRQAFEEEHRQQILPDVQFCLRTDLSFNLFRLRLLH